MFFNSQKTMNKVDYEGVCHLCLFKLLVFNQLKKSKVNRNTLLFILVYDDNRNGEILKKKKKLMSMQDYVRKHSAYDS